MENLYLESAVNRIYEESSDFDWITDSEINMLEFDGYHEYWIDISNLTNDEKRSVGEYIKRHVNIKDGIDGDWGITVMKEFMRSPRVYYGIVVHCGVEDYDYKPKKSFICTLNKPFESDDNNENSQYIDGRMLLNDIIKESNNLSQLKETEDKKPSAIKGIIKDIVSDLKLSGKFVSTFGTGITAFYEPIAKLLSGSGLHLDKFNIVLMIITGVAFMIQDTDFNKLRDSLKEKGILQHLKTVTDFIDGSQKLVNGVLKNVSNATYGLADIMAFTFILAPTMNILSELIGEYGISGNSIGQLFTGLVAGVATYGIKSVLGKLRKRL